MDRVSQKRRLGVRYTFYKKPMASQISILRRCAIMEGTKVSTTSAELRRRWRNISEYCEKSEFESVTQDYMDDLEGMGYPEPWRAKVLMGAIKGYTRVLYTCSLGLTRRNRNGKSTKVRRRFKMMIGPSTWF